MDQEVKLIRPEVLLRGINDIYYTIKADRIVYRKNVDIGDNCYGITRVNKLLFCYKKKIIVETWSRRDFKTVKKALKELKTIYFA